MRIRTRTPPNGASLIVGVAVGTLCLAMGAAFPVAAQTMQGGVEALTMAEAVRAAVLVHPSIRGAQAQAQQADEGVAAARAGYRPQITGGIEGQTYGRRNSSYDSRHVYTATVNASQMLYDFGKVAGVVRQAEAGVRARKAQRELVTDGVILSVSQAWIDAHLQQSLVRIAREQLAAVTSIAALVNERVSKGATSRSDLEQANSRVDALRSQLLSAEAEAQRASLALMHLTGRTAPVIIAGDIPPALRGDACQADFDAASPSVRMAEAQRDDARAQLDIARAERRPTLTLDGSVGYALTEGSRLNGEYRTTGEIGVNVSMPLYQGGATQARERGAFHQLRAYEDAVQQARLEARQGLTDVMAQAEGWATRAPVLATRVNSIDATRDLYRQQYLQLGTRSLLELLNAEQEYHSARVDQLQGVYAQHHMAAQCLYHRGRLYDAFGVAGDASGGEVAVAGGVEP